MAGGWLGDGGGMGGDGEGMAGGWRGYGGGFERGCNLMALHCHDGDPVHSYQSVELERHDGFGNSENITLEVGKQHRQNMSERNRIILLKTARQQG